MDLEKKIWAASAVLFFTLGMAAFFIFAHPLSILQENNPHVDVPLFVLMSTASYFCVLMMIRPLATDFGILHGLSDITAFLTKQFGTGRRYWLAFGLCTMMIFLRLVTERRSVVHLAARQD